jgi:hypothetical protein
MHLHRDNHHSLNQNYYAHVRVWNKTEKVPDSHSAITKDSSLQGLGQALQFFKTLATTCPTKHHTQQTRIYDKVCPTSNA